jgi:hypothetical protein
MLHTETVEPGTLSLLNKLMVLRPFNHFRWLEEQPCRYDMAIAVRLIRIYFFTKNLTLP